MSKKLNSEYNNLNKDDLISKLETMEGLLNQLLKQQEKSSKPSKKATSKGSNTKRPITQEEYNLLIKTILQGFQLSPNGKRFLPNKRLALILIAETNIGIRIGDVLQLRLSDFKVSGDSIHIDIIEEKTSKRRNFNVPKQIYDMLTKYCSENNIKETALIFPIQQRVVQKNIKKVCDYLGLKDISTHSFRKLAALRIYKESNYNLETVRQFLQHSSIKTTQIYIRTVSSEFDKLVSNTVTLPEIEI